jgi:hypothetical protein
MDAVSSISLNVEFKIMAVITESISGSLSIEDPVLGTVSLFVLISEETGSRISSGSTRDLISSWTCRVVIKDNNFRTEAGR